jgi:pyrroloquinoline quinone biosynthesis protein B
LQRRVSCLAIVDPATSERWMIDATPDFPSQLRALDDIAPITSQPILAGIFLTHGHIGHYSGLMHLGREVMGARDISVHVMPRMREFLSTSGPWDQLIRLRNIILQPLQDGVRVKLNERISVLPFLVPHRDEYTETVGFRITGPQRSVVFIPDIDKWDKWTTRIEDLLSEVDRAYLDGTFYSDGEVPGRAMPEIPHPFIVESMQRFSVLPATEKAKVRFIHLNHTNPGLREESEAARRIKDAGFKIAHEGERFEL